MNAEELQEATKQFDRPMIAKAARPLNAEERKLWRRLTKSAATKRIKPRKRRR